MTEEDLKRYKALLELAEELFLFAEHGDYSNGVEFYGVDEGNSRAGDYLRLLRDRLDGFLVYHLSEALADAHKKLKDIIGVEHQTETDVKDDAVYHMPDMTACAICNKKIELFQSLVCDSQGRLVHVECWSCGG